MTTDVHHWTVDTGLNDYGWFESHTAACAFARIVGGGTIHEYRNIRLIESKEVTREEYEELAQQTKPLLDPSDYAFND